MTLDEAREHAGARVVYDPGYLPHEQGVITAVSDRWVFVRYGDDQMPKATPADTLTLAPESVPDGFVEVVTRYGGYKHLAPKRETYGDGWNLTLCRGTSAWPIPSWEAVPDHPFLSIDAIKQLPHCPTCTEQAAQA